MNTGQAVPINNVTRIEIVDQNGVLFSLWKVSEVKVVGQDNGRTLKVFCTTVAVGEN